MLEVPGSVAVCFDAPVVELFEQRTEALHPSLSQLGPDLLADPVDVDEAMRRLRRPGARDLTIAEALLDQRALAGIGNEVKNLVLWEAGLSPWTPLRDVDDAALRGLVVRSAEAPAHRRRDGPPAAGSPRPGRAPVPAMRDDRAGEGARPRAAAPDLLVPELPARPEERGEERGMTDAIDVRCEPTGDSWTCFVTVTGGGTSTQPRRLDDPGRPRPVRARRRHARRPRPPLVRVPAGARAEDSILGQFDLPVIGRYFPEYEADDHPPAIAGRRGPERLEAALDHLVVAVSETRNQPGFSTIVPGSTSDAELGEAVREREVVGVGRPDHEVERALGHRRLVAHLAQRRHHPVAPRAAARRCRSTASRGRGARAGAARWGTPSRRRTADEDRAPHSCPRPGIDGRQATKPIRWPGASIVLP